MKTELFQRLLARALLEQATKIHLEAGGTQGAATLATLSRYVDDLPANDQRIALLSRLMPWPQDRLTPGEHLSEAISRVGLHPTVPMPAALEALTAPAAADFVDWIARNETAALLLSATSATDDPLQGLASIRTLAERLDELRQRDVQLARAQNVPWAVIGALLGMTRQGSEKSQHRAYQTHLLRRQLDPQYETGFNHGVQGGDTSGMNGSDPANALWMDGWRAGSAEHDMRRAAARAAAAISLEYMSEAETELVHEIRSLGWEPVISPSQRSDGGLGYTGQMHRGDGAIRPARRNGDSPEAPLRSLLEIAHGGQGA